MELMSAAFFMCVGLYILFHSGHQEPSLISVERRTNVEPDNVYYLHSRERVATEQAEKKAA